MISLGSQGKSENNELPASARSQQDDFSKIIIHAPKLLHSGQVVSMLSALHIVGKTTCLIAVFGDS